MCHRQLLFFCSSRIYTMCVCVIYYSYTHSLCELRHRHVNSQRLSRVLLHPFSTDRLTDFMPCIIFVSSFFSPLPAGCVQYGIKSDLLDLYIRLADFTAPFLTVWHKSFVDLRQTGNPRSLSFPFASSLPVCVFVMELSNSFSCLYDTN